MALYPKKFTFSTTKHALQFVSGFEYFQLTQKFNIQVIKKRALCDALLGENLLKNSNLNEKFALCAALCALAGNVD